MTYLLDQSSDKDMARFWAFVSKTSDCWNWVGRRQAAGYGQFWLRGQMRQAYRVVWVAEHGLLEDHMELDHLCRNRSCVNPAHLEPVTREENMRRTQLIAVGKCRGGLHPIRSEGDLYTNATTGYRTCRACIRERKRRYRRERRAATAA